MSAKEEIQEMMNEVDIDRDGFIDLQGSVRYHEIGHAELELEFLNPMFDTTKYLDLELNYNSNSSQFHNLNSICEVDNWNFK